MLIDFSVVNFRSFHARQTLSMIASSAKEFQVRNCITDEKNVFPPLLRTAVIYGPNAAGKTNLIKAIHFMQNMVLTSATSLQQGELLNVSPFAFNQKSRKEPSEFEIHFIANGVRYQYGFSTNVSDVIEEWLIAYPNGRQQTWFQRSFNKRTKRPVWKFGPNFKGNNKLWREATRNNGLFLSTAVQLNNEQLKDIFNWFQQKLVVVLPSLGVVLNPVLTHQLLATEDGKSSILKFLAAADVGIDDVELTRRTLSNARTPQAPFQGQLFLGNGGVEAISIKAIHRDLDTKEPIPLDISDESEGTQKLLLSAGGWLKVLNDGGVLFVDELNNSLHPLLVRFLVDLFQNKKANSQNSQLVFSTHDTSILDKDVFRRDQIWFAEKDKTNATNLYALSDFSPRKDDAFERNYLKGRYGALPNIGELL